MALGPGLSFVRFVIGDGRARRDVHETRWTTGSKRFPFIRAYLEEIADRLAAANSQRRDDINKALGVGMDRRGHGNVEVKYGGPDGVIIDVSETGWVGTSPLDK